MKVLLTGANGQVGAAVRRTVPHDAELLPLTHDDLDIADACSIQKIVEEFRPELIVNAAAYTAVDKAEAEPASAAAANTDGPRHLAEACAAVAGCRLIQVSTDYVFSGEKQAPYLPEDVPHPLSVYGRTKAAGERAVTGVLASRAVILRTAWVYSAQGKNFLLTMLRLMGQRPAVHVVADQVGSPTSAASIATAVWRIAQRPSIHGVIHWTDAGTATWFDFATAIATDAYGIGLLERTVEVIAISSAEYPTPVRRPAYSVLDIDASAVTLGLWPKPWRSNLQQVLADIKATSVRLERGDAA